MLSTNGKPPLTQSSVAACEEEEEEEKKKKWTTTTAELPVQGQPLSLTAGINGNKEDNVIPWYSRSAALQRGSDVDFKPYESKHIDTTTVAEADTSLMQVSPSVNQKVLELLDNWPANGGKHDIKTTPEPDVLYAGRSTSPIDHKFEDIIFYARTFNEDLQGYILEAKVKRQYAGCDFVAPSVATTKTQPSSMVYSTATAPTTAPIPTNDGSDVDEKIENTEHRIIYASRCQS
ncbi:unnamed protein product [Dibothriocephalus latus]|uniref:Uncharacterized protein n=1 Tax=Dibothriocephalus latus TaxID=60516 RepID=A0A3P7MAL6_DIBLA|nr:unnamed protein product [Dibothriocephalus latus]